MDRTVWRATLPGEPRREQRAHGRPRGPRAHPRDLGASTPGGVAPRIYDERVIHLESPTHRIPSDQTGADEQAGPLLTSSGEDYAQALASITEQMPAGHRLTSIRRVAAH
jgi:hypothetical protein